MRFRKKPVVVEAMQYDPKNKLALYNWVTECGGQFHTLQGDRSQIVTLEGAMTMRPGGWVVKGVKGEFYPIEDSIFRETYEPIQEDDDR